MLDPLLVLVFDTVLAVYLKLWKLKKWSGNSKEKGLRDKIFWQLGHRKRTTGN